MLYTILIVILILLLIGVLPNFAHMQRFDLGWGPPGAVALLIIVVVILLLTGRA